MPLAWLTVAALSGGRAVRIRTGPSIASQRVERTISVVAVRPVGRAIDGIGGYPVSFAGLVDLASQTLQSCNYCPSRAPLAILSWFRHHRNAQPSTPSQRPHLPPSVMSPVPIPYHATPQFQRWSTGTFQREGTGLPTRACRACSPSATAMVMV